jgi:hypothetical protein
MELEQRLRQSLAAREAPAGFEAAVLARVAQRPGSAALPDRRGLAWRWPAALAATVLAAAFGLHWYAEQQRASRNHEQLLLALAITSHALDEVQQKLIRTDEFRTRENGT